MKKTNLLHICILSLATLGLSVPIAVAQTKKAATGNVSDIEKQKKQADSEIAQTKKAIGTNDKAVTAGLSDLRKIEGEIASSQKEIEVAKGQITTLHQKISALEKSINTGEGELEKLRAEYLKAIKKMRVARKKTSGLAFIFSSKNFNEARRRLRYLREFGDWKERQSATIMAQVEELKVQKQELVQAKNDADVALKRQVAAQDKLKHQQSEQQTVIRDLRANGDALREHLARKQAEARKLGNQISQLIAEQQAKEAREAEERRKAQEKKAAEERQLAQQRKLEEEKRLEAERKKAEANAKVVAEEKKPAEEKKVAEKKPAEKKPAEKPAKETKPAAKPAKQEEPEVSYADARKKKPRSDGASKTETTTPKEAPAAASASASGFGGMKGSLPKPVSGSFRIISAFGVHPVSPDMPDIMDENTGIDVHVANGASACAIYEGEVIKIYDRTNTPGFRNIVVVKHGDYITVYANLESLAVHSGQKVKQGQALGTVGSDFDDPSHGLIHFEIWKNQTRLDPAAWIKR